MVQVMKIIHIFLIFNTVILCVLLTTTTMSQGRGMDSEKYTQITGVIHTSEKIDSITIYWDGDRNIPDWHNWRKTIPVKNGHFHFGALLKQPAQFAVKDNFRNLNFVEPGDSINLEIFFLSNKDSIRYSGKGAMKCQLVQQLEKIKTDKKKPTSRDVFVSTSLNDFLYTSEYYKDIQINRLKYLEKYKDQLSTRIYSIIQAYAVCDPEYYRVGKFRDLLRKKDEFDLTDKDIDIIYDTVINNSLINAIQTSDDLAFCINYLSYAIFVFLPNKAAFDNKHEFEKYFSNPETIYHNQYLLTKQLYSGLLRERVITRVLKYYMKYVPATSEILQNDLSDYIQQENYADYKSFIADIQSHAAGFTKGSIAPNFSLPDKYGNSVSLNDLKGKVVLLDFWFTGCHPCAALVPTLDKIHEEFQNDSNVVLINISIDSRRQVWLNSLNRKKYTTGKGICLYTNEEGSSHRIIKDYRVSGYPRLVLLDKSGEIISFSPPDSRPQGNGGEMIELIRKLAKQ